MAFPTSFSGNGAGFNGSGIVGKGGENASPFLPGGNTSIHSVGNQSGALQQVRCLACGQANHVLNPYCSNCRGPLQKTVIQWGQCDSQDSGKLFTGHPGSPLTPPPPQVCTICGTSNHNSAVNCGKCNSSLGLASNSGNGNGNAAPPSPFAPASFGGNHGGNGNASPASPFVGKGNGNGSASPASPFGGNGNAAPQSPFGGNGIPAPQSPFGNGNGNGKGSFGNSYNGNDNGFNGFVNGHQSSNYGKGYPQSPQAMAHTYGNQFTPSRIQHQCHTCNAYNANTRSHCWQCLAPLSAQPSPEKGQSGKGGGKSGSFKLCIQCGASNASHYYYCNQCKFRFDPSSPKGSKGKGKSKTVNAHDSGKGRGQCSTCGSLVSLSHNNCTQCGTPTTSSSPVSKFHGHPAHAPPVDTNGSDEFGWGAEGAHVDPFKDIDGKAYNLGKGAHVAGTDADASYVDPSKDTDGKAFNLGKGACAVGSSDVASSYPASNGNVQSSPFGKGNASTSNGNAQSLPFGKGKDNASTSNGNVQSSPFGNAPNTNGTEKASSSASGMFGAGDATFTIVVKQHDSHKLPQFVPPSSMLDPLLQWKCTLDYLGKVGDACHLIDAELSKLKSAKDRLLALAVPAWSVKKQLAAKIPNLPQAAQVCAPPNPDAVFGLARSFIYSPEDSAAFDIIVEKALQAIRDSDADAEMSAPSQPPEPTPAVFPISSDDDDLQPEKLDFEGASGVFDHPEAPDMARVEPSTCIGKRLFGKQAHEQVKPPRSRSRSPGSDGPGIASSGSSLSADSGKMLTKNQKKKLREKASKVRKTSGAAASS
jgi:hypothetical protein